MKEKIQALLLRFKAAFQSDRRVRYGVFAGAGALLAAASFSIYALTASYKLHPEIRNLAQLTPENATWFLAAESPAALRALWMESSAAHATRSSAAWNNLAQTPEMVRLSALLYFLELKSGTTLGWGFELLNRPVAAARLDNGSLLFLARLNLTSQIGVKLLNAFKGKTIALPNESAFDKPPAQPQPAPSNSEEESPSEYVVKPEDSVPALVEKRETLRNLEISHIDLGESGLYLTLLDDVLFASDSLESLEDALELAGSPAGASVAALPGMQAALQATANQESRALAMVTPGAGPPGALALLVGGDQGVAAVFEFGGDAPPAADLYAIGKSRFPVATDGAAGPTAGPDWANLLPADAAIAIYSRHDTLAQLLESGKDAGGAPRDMALAAEDLLQKARLDLAAWNQAGLALVFHGFKLHQERLYPEASLGANVPAAELERFRLALFGAGQIQSAIFQGGTYSKLLRREKFYQPAVARIRSVKSARAEASFLSATPAGLESLLAAAAGARPDLSDAPARQLLAAHADAPVQVVLHLPSARRAVRDLLLREGARSGRFTETTVDRDVMALFDALGAYASLHIASGRTAAPAGRMTFAR